MINFDKDLVNDIYTKLKEAWSEETVPENNDILARIKANIKLYGNTPIEDLNPENSWVQIKTPNVHDMKFINTKGYEKHLEICRKIDEDYKNYIKQKRIINNHMNFNNMNFSQFLSLEKPVPWDNFLKLKAYRCVLTKSIGFTYCIKNTFIIKPFNIIKHNWELKEAGGHDTLYVCKNCNTNGCKKKGMPAAEIFPIKDFMLSCNEIIIKKLLE